MAQLVNFEIILATMKMYIRPSQRMAAQDQHEAVMRQIVQGGDRRGCGEYFPSFQKGIKLDEHGEAL